MGKTLDIENMMQAYMHKADKLREEEAKKKENEIPKIGFVMFSIVQDRSMELLSCPPQHRYFTIKYAIMICDSSLKLVVDSNGYPKINDGIEIVDLDEINEKYEDIEGIIKRWLGNNGFHTRSTKFYLYDPDLCKNKMDIPTNPDHDAIMYKKLPFNMEAIVEVIKDNIRGDQDE